jgi:hypothetical protein
LRVSKKSEDFAQRNAANDIDRTNI